MKIKPTPTSPKFKNKDRIIEELYSNKNIEKIEKPKKNSKTSILTIIILSLIFGFFAGIISNLIINTYGSQIPIINQLGINSFFTQSFFIRKNQTEEINKEKIKIMIEEISPSVVSIFDKKDETKKDISLIYLDSEKKGIGLFVTSDGLIITTRQVIDDINKDYVIITDNKEILRTEGILIDPATYYVFLKVKTNNKTVIKLSNPSEIYLGEKLYSIDKNINTDEKIYLSFYVKNKNYHIDKNLNGLLNLTDKYTNGILIDNYITIKGNQPIINEKNEIVGLLQSLNNENVVLPIYFAQSAVEMILTDNKIERPFLGISYLKISDAINIPESVSFGKKDGALIYSYNEDISPSIIKNSPAEKAGFKKEDIILKVGDIKIDSDNDLLNIIQEFKPGNILDFTLFRAGVEKNIKVELSKL